MMVQVRHSVRAYPFQQVSHLPRYHCYVAADNEKTGFGRFANTEQTITLNRNERRCCDCRE